MSIPDVEVNMEGIFSSGQAYVALSRALSAAGLSISGYNKKLVYANSSAIRFYEEVKCGLKKAGEQGRGGEGKVTTSIFELCQ